MTAVDVESLYVSSIDAKPITVEAWSDFGDYDSERFNYWQTFTREGEGDTTHTLLSRDGQVSGVVVAGTFYDSHDDYAADWEEDHPTDCTCVNTGKLQLHDAGCPVPNAEDLAPMDERDWGDLMDADPYMSGAEGPMMNYWYPVDSIDDDDDAQTAAVAIAGLPLCVVHVDGNYGLALTGGGMDLSWDICRAYIATGNLPPVHFADLPEFAGGHEYSADVVAAMRRSLTITEERAARARERLGVKFGGVL